jgi:AcrR family transcriptional regulator
MVARDPESPAASRRKRADGLRTIERILEAAEAEMAEHGIIKFNLDRVIEKSGVARSSVYHHFGSRDSLIAALETSHAMRSLERGLADFESAVGKMECGEEAFSLIELGIQMFGSAENRQRRQRRISSLAAAHNSSAIREVLAKDQLYGSQNLARLLAKVRERGLADPIGPDLGLAYVIQSMLVGRVLVDISDDPDLDAQWEQAAIASLRQILRPIRRST